MFGSKSDECPKCQKTIDNNWLSCPFCGVTLVKKAPEQPQYQSSAMNPKKSIKEKLIDHHILLFGLILGLFIMLIGALAINYSILTDVDDGEDIDDSSKNDDLDDKMNYNKNGIMIYNAGMFLFSISAIVLAVLDDKLNQFVRLGLLFIAGMISFNMVGIMNQ